MKANAYTVHARLAALENFATETTKANEALRVQLEQAQKALAAVQIIARSPIQGPQGIAGAVGSVGPRGADGRPGKDGLDGKDSTVAGPPGRDGLDGRDATVPTESELGVAVQVLRDRATKFVAAIRFARDVNSRRKHEGLKAAVENVLRTVENNSQ